jgi:glutamine synthetase
VDKALKNGSNACNYLLSCDMVFNPVPNTNIASYEKGFGDFTMKADMDSIREITYINDQKQLLFFADLVNSQTDMPITHAPRYLLRQSVQDLKALGFSIQVECDINFTIFFDKYRKLSENFHHAQTVTEHSNLYNTVYKQNLDDFFNRLKVSLKTSGIHVEKMTGDKAPGQFRLSLKACDVLEFCDNITLLKLCIKKLADESDKSVSFMAKLNEEWLGNSLDLKLIIKDEKKNNILDSKN